MKKVVFTFGRLNPPTIGHQKLIEKVKAVAKQQGADARVYLSHTQNKKKDPLDYNSKVKYATKAFGSIVTKTNAKTIIQVLKELQDAGYTDVTLIVGSDRIPEFKKLLTKYNGKDYTFNSINFTSAGQRDPDAEGVEGMSASKMRALAVEGDFASFKSGLPKGLQPMAKEVYNKLRNIMEEEDKELDEGVLTLQQRKKRSLLMKRLSRKIALKRKIASKRMADTKRLQRRALKKARAIIRKRVAGQKGSDYASLSTAQKITIDKMVEKKRGLIAKIAKKLLPRVRKQEQLRLQKARGSVKTPGQKDIYKTTRREERETLTLNKQDLNEQNVQEVNFQKEPNLYRALVQIDREKARDYKKFDRMRDQARVRDVIYRNRYGTWKKEGVNEGGEAADFDMDPEEKAARKPVPVPSYYKDKGVKTWKDMPKLKVKDENPPSGLRLAHLTVKGEQNLREKAERNGIEFEELMSVYENAIIDSNSNNTEEQQRFAAVNHYVAEAKQVDEIIVPVARTFAALMGKQAVKKVNPVTKSVKDPKQRTPAATFTKSKPEESPVYTKPSNEAVATPMSASRAAGDRKKYPAIMGEESQMKKFSDIKEASVADAIAAAKAKLSDYVLRTTGQGTSNAKGEKIVYTDKDAPKKEEKDDLKDACWKGYKAVGLKKKNGKNVPNCVPEETEVEEAVRKPRTLGRLLQQKKSSSLKYTPPTEAEKEADRKKDRNAPSQYGAMKGKLKEDCQELGPEGKAKEKSEKNHKKKMLKDILPKSGAGQEGTDELVKTYLAQTPGMTIEGYCPETNELKEELVVEAAEYQGKKVKLNDPFRLPAGSKKKFGVYVKNEKGNVVKVTFGDPNMEIKRDDPKRRAAFRSRHSCDDNIGPKWKARYWSCYQWRAGKKVDN